jgi:hypothetical protein
MAENTNFSDDGSYGLSRTRAEPFTKICIFVALNTPLKNLSN